MDLITEVVNARLPINTKCIAKIAKIEGQRIALRKRINIAMVIDFKVTVITEKVAERIRKSWLPDQPYKSKATALLVNSLVGGKLAYGNLMVNYWAELHWFNVVDGNVVDVCQNEQYVRPNQVINREDLLTEPELEAAYEGMVNRYMRNFMEEIK